MARFKRPEPEDDRVSVDVGLALLTTDALVAEYPESAWPYPPDLRLSVAVREGTIPDRRALAKELRTLAAALEVA